MGWIAPLPRVWQWNRFMAANTTGFLGGVLKCLHANKRKWPWLEFDLFVLGLLNSADGDCRIPFHDLQLRLYGLWSFSTLELLKIDITGTQPLSCMQDHLARKLIVKPNCKCLTYRFSSQWVTAAGHADLCWQRHGHLIHHGARIIFFL